jgi:beta-glucanase (GH16 family)
MKKYFLIFILLSGLTNYAQFPANDPTWTITRQDLFNSSTLDPQWNTSYPWGTQYNNGLEWNYPANLLLSYDPGYLSIKCDVLSPPYSYTDASGAAKTANYQGGVISSSWTAKYGYFEVSAKMPIGRGFWPAFWVWGASSSPTCWYNEIDIVENGGAENNNADQMGFCAWGYPSSTPPCPSFPTSPFQTYGLIVGPGVHVTGNTANEHKYAVFWEPGKMTYYYDDAPVQVVEDAVLTPSHAITTIINFAVDPWYSPDASTTYPAYFKLNHFKLWQLTADCNTAVSFCSNFNPATYVSKVKKSISLEGSGCSDNINTSNNINFWATDYILLDVGTSITDNGSGSFSANITGCPN